jgi:hypothetical protein
MNAPALVRQFTEASPRFKARLAGALFLLSLLAAVFGEFIVRRFEIPADLIAVSGMIAVTVVLYDLFRPVSRSLSLLAASFNLVGLGCGALRWNPQGVDVPVVMNGFYCFLMGFLIFRSSLLPRLVGALMAIGGLGWVTYLFPPLAAHLSPYNLAAGILGEGSVMLWLLVMGVSVQPRNEQAIAGRDRLTRPASHQDTSP